MSKLEELAKTLVAKGPVKTEKSKKRVRLLHQGKYIADTTEALYVWEHPYYPQYWLPTASLLAPPPKTHETADYTLHEAPSAPQAITLHTGPLADHMRVTFSSIQAWFEEDEPIFIHPRDPHVRIDALPSSRRVQVFVDDEEVADSGTGGVVALFESEFLPVRWYLPATSLTSWEAVVESDTTTGCPYKGVASYYGLTVKGKTYEDVIWYYKAPLRESLPVQGKICFYNEKVEIHIDGVKQEQPKSKFS